MLGPLVMTLDNNKCDSCSITNINIHESVSNPDSKEDNLPVSWMPHKDYKIINKKKITSKFDKLRIITLNTL